MENLYPIRFKEHIRNYGFGDRWIVTAYEKTGLPDDNRVAETWEVVDRKGESSVVTNGPLAGKNLHELIQMYGVQLLGRDVVQRCGTRFPLLIKFLDASNVLGEQAHHSDALAAQQGLEDPGKTEAWYMLKVREGATIHCGHKAGVTADALRQALIEGSSLSLMQEYPVQPGDGFLLHAGTMHYSKGGVLFYEIMQNSDVYISLKQLDPGLSEDEKRGKLRFLLDGVHLEDSFDPKIAPVKLREGENDRTFAFVCGYFALERLDLRANAVIDCDGERFYVLSQIEGSSVVSGENVREELRPGNTLFLPADLGKVTIHPGPDCVLLKAYVPDLRRDIIQPMRAAGIEDALICGLGGHTRLNPLRDLM